MKRRDFLSKAAHGTLALTAFPSALPDKPRLKGVFSGINIKLMKCTGIRRAYKMMAYARAEGMTVIIGCMTETSCAVTATATLSPLVDFADLDGNLLISDDLYEGVSLHNGRLTLLNRPDWDLFPRKTEQA